MGFVFELRVYHSYLSLYIIHTDERVFPRLPGHGIYQYDATLHPRPISRSN